MTYENFICGNYLKHKVHGKSVDILLRKSVEWIIRKREFHIVTARSLIFLFMFKIKCLEEFF